MCNRLLNQQEPAVASKETNSGRRLNRRTIMKYSWGAGLVTSACGIAATLSAKDIEPESPSTPEEALKQLYAGNARFVRGESLSEHRDMDRVRKIASKQTPFAAFLGCADSRVPIEFVFDQGFGDLFVTRIAGNIASSENIGSLEFGARVLGAKVLYVLGHSSCGAVTATIKGEEVPGQISGLFQYIRPAIKAAGGDVDKAIRENVKNQALILAESSPVIARLVRSGELIVAGGVYDLSTGIVSPVELPMF
jgi:carbonic anhydrase